MTPRGEVQVQNQICTHRPAVIKWIHEVSVLLFQLCTSPVFVSALSLSDTLEPTYQQLQKMKLDKSPFVVVSVIGQELLTHGFHGASVVVLEAGLKIGTCSLKLRGSVFSALSSAYWSLGNAEKSMAYMQQDLEVTKTLGMEEEEREQSETTTRV